MGNVDSDQGAFSATLRKECDRVLDDLIFKRAPVQSKLLAFLCDRSCKGDANLSQYIVAVDGLDRSEDYDTIGDSYPRVQMSRLRSNLANYYSRNRSDSGHCIYIESGDYHLKLAPRDKAYPNASDSGLSQTGQETTGAAQDHSASLNQSTSNASVGFSDTSKIALACILFSAILLIGVVINYEPYSTASKMKQAPPTISLSISANGFFDESDLNRQLRSDVTRSARIKLADSLVSELDMGATPTESQTDYTVEIDLGDGLHAPEATVFLIDGSDTEIFSSIVLLSDGREHFLRRINARLATILGPNGIIAKREVSKMVGPPATGYQCWLLIESQREKGFQIGSLLDDCIERFPNEKYTASWLARKALSFYLALVIEGKTVQSDAAGWLYISQALQMNQYDPYANFIAAKVSIAEGNCDAAQVFSERARTRGSSYPALVAATYAESGGCLTDGMTSEIDSRAEIIALIETNPMPNTPLRLNLVVASLSNGFTDLAARSAALPVTSIEGNDPAIDLISDTVTVLERANDDPEYFRANRRKVERQLELFVWNNAARNRVLENLET